MRNFIAGYVLVLASSAIAQTSPVTMPTWLVPYPGAKVEAKTALPILIESTYTIAAKPDAVLAHYKKVWKPSADFKPNFDGIGTSLRTSAPECEVLVHILEDDAGTRVKTSCAAKPPPPPPMPIPEVAVTPVSTSPGDDATKRVLAEAEARHKKGIQDMEKYDKPVPPAKKAPPVPKMQ